MEAKIDEAEVATETDGALMDVSNVTGAAAAAVGAVAVVAAAGAGAAAVVRVETEEATEDVAAPGANDEESATAPSVTIIVVIKTYVVLGCSVTG